MLSIHKMQYFAIISVHGTQKLPHMYTISVFLNHCLKIRLNHNEFKSLTLLIGNF